MRMVAAVAVLVWLAALSGYDVRERRLPNLLTLPGAGVILLAGATAGRGWPALAGATALTAIYLLVHLAAPAGMGAGDVKLAIGVGALAGCFGAGVWFLAALAAPLLTVSWGLLHRLFGGGGGSSLPHGPSMCVATAAAIGLAVG